MGLGTLHQSRPRRQEHQGLGQRNHRQSCQRPSQIGVWMGGMDAKSRRRRHAQGRSGKRSTRPLGRRPRGTTRRARGSNQRARRTCFGCTCSTTTSPSRLLEVHKPSACTWFRDTTFTFQLKPSASLTWTTSTICERPISMSMTNNHLTINGVIPGVLKLGSTPGQAIHHSFGGQLLEFLRLKHKHLLHYHSVCQRKPLQVHLVGHRHRGSEPTCSRNFARPIYIMSAISLMYASKRRASRRTLTTGP